jgi:GTP pyrophosphokinase/guanosine-3',5'-bis(diphosphate) 3'-pyrophosphohydrolase
MLAQALRSEGLALPPRDDEAGAQLWQQLARWASLRNADELLFEIGVGRKIASIVAKQAARMLREAGARPDAVLLSMGRYANDDALAQGSVLLDGSEGASVRYAPCCHPIPGDEIRGYLGRGEGLLVHTAECATGRKLFQRDSEHWIGVAWADELTRPFVSEITLLLTHAKGVLAQVAAAVSAAEADIDHVEMDKEYGLERETAEMRMLIAVRDRHHLAEVLRGIRRLPPVRQVKRVKPQAAGS